MKLKTFILSLFAAVMALSSCSSMTSISNSKDYLNGSTAGTVLTQLNRQFQSAGTVDLSNVQNILNLSTLASTLTSLTNGSNASTNDFTGGLLSTASSLVTKENSSKVVSTLSELAGLDLAGVTSSLQRGSDVKSEKLSDIQSTLDSVFSLFKK